MRLPGRSAIGVFVALLGWTPTVHGEESVRTTVAVVAEIPTRTSLKVSAQVLQFVVSGPDQPGLATVEFSAGARTREGGEVVLSIEPLSAADCPDAANARVTFAGEGSGTTSGTLGGSGTTAVARWTGSGLRAGRLTFALYAPAGLYTVPLRFVLSAP